VYVVYVCCVRMCVNVCKWVCVCVCVVCVYVCLCVRMCQTIRNQESDARWCKHILTKYGLEKFPGSNYPDFRHAITLNV